MNSKTLRFFSLFTGGLMLAAGALAQTPKVDFPAPSPACTLKQRVGVTDIEIVYSRPGVKDRAIFGSLVPYGQVWRTGANNATKITFSTPGENEWTIIINKGAAQWGAFQYDEKVDVARFKATPVTLSKPMETFVI